MNSNMIEKKTWEEFRNAGMLFLVNTLLHPFGWCIVVEVEDGNTVGCYPARTRFRGFDEKTQTDEHVKIAKYLAENAPKFPEEIK